MTRGMVLGKFLPPHLGHVHLVSFAERCVDDLTVVVGTLAAEPIPGALRHRWMCELFPAVRVVHLTDENPQAPGEHPRFWDVWRESLLRVLPAAPDLVFASEAYGARLAAELGARFVPVDPGRGAFPVSGTAVRADPYGHFHLLPLPVRAHYAVRVCVFGPESTGKSTLAARLAEHFGARLVPEYARTWLESRGGELVEADLVDIARGQAASEDLLAGHSRGLVVCDTDVLETVVWSEALYGRCDPAIAAAADTRSCDLYLVTDVDVPWVADPVRYLPEVRQGFLDRCLAALDARNRRYVRVSGDWQARFETARDAVSALLAERGVPERSPGSAP